MSNAKIELPTNRKFGLFFTFVFLVVASYFFLRDSILISYIFFALAAVLLLITFINEHALLPLNKLWMRFGQLLGIIISPMILGIIFFGIFTPYSLLMRLFGRDELQLKLGKRKSFCYLNHKNLVMIQIER